MLLRISSAAMLIAAVLCNASAHASEASRVANYPVQGATAKAVYDDIVAHAPRIAPNATFAFTTIATKTDKTEAKAKASCGYKRFKTSAYYIFTLPKHRNPSALGKATRAKWLAFAQYLKVHEETHREMWRKCLADYDAGALKLEAKTCDALDRQREKLFTKIKLACVAQDERFDYYFRKDVLKEPFLKEALGREKKK